MPLCLCGCAASDVHGHEELGIGARLADAVHEQLHRLHRVVIAQHPAEGAHPLQLFGIQEQLFLAGPGAVDVQGGEDPALGDPPVENDLQVPGALELLEDHLVHA